MMKPLPMLPILLLGQAGMALSYRSHDSGRHSRARTLKGTGSYEYESVQKHPKGARRRHLDESDENLLRYDENIKIIITNPWYGSYEQQTHHNEHDPPSYESPFFHYGKGGKGGKGKSKKSKAPSASPSMSPSFSPSISTQPSDKPSKAPTDIPSQFPSQSPTDRPSDLPSVLPSNEPSQIPSLSPSRSPSNKPSFVPSTSPSSKPSNIPSDYPSDVPSFAPSRNPTATPSISPSMTPSVSSLPSSTPSISSMPTLTHIGGVSIIEDENGNVGKQTGCKPKTKEEERLYAEYNVERNPVSFRYLLRFASDGDLTKDSAMTAMEEALHESLFMSSVEPCDRDGRLRMRRYLRDDQAVGEIPLQERPIALTTLPKDVEGNQSCRDSVQGETCIIVEGGLTMVFPQDYEYNMNNTELNLLAQIKQTMNGAKAFWNNEDLKGVRFLGAESIGYEGAGMYVASISNEAQANDNISATGGVMIGSAAILVLAAAIGVRQRRQSYRHASQNLLDKDLYEMPSDVGENSTTYEQSNPSPHRPPLFGNGRLKLPSEAPTPFEMGFVHVHANRETGEYDYEVSSNRPTPIHLQRQDVHHCTSASCEICGMKGSQRNRGIRMIDQSEWYEEDNVDFSEIEFESMGSAVPRTYDAPDTISL